MTRIVFMGTPEFAVPVLKELANHYAVVAVYTRADKPAGRGKQLVESPVKIFAREHELAIEQPRTLKHGAEQSRLRQYQPDLIVVAAYGLIVPQPVLDLPPTKCVNVHPSLLPRWRGASPITFAILAGDQETGVTLMQLDAGLDTGPIITARATPIAPDETTGTLTPKLAQLGTDLLLETLPAWLKGQLTTKPQDNSKSTMSRLIAKEDGHVNWHKPAVEIERMVRAFNPWPGAFTYLSAPPALPHPDKSELVLKIHRAAVSSTGTQHTPGMVLELGKDIGVQTGDGVLILHEVQPAGKRAMSIDEFVHGHRGFVGMMLGGNPSK